MFWMGTAGDAVVAAGSYNAIMKPLGAAVPKPELVP